MANVSQEEQQVIYRPTPFNFVDMQEKADAYIETVRAEAARIADETRAELTRLRNSVNADLEVKQRNLAELERSLLEREKKLEDEMKRVNTLKGEIEKATYDGAKDKGHKEGYDSGYEQGYAAGEERAEINHEERVKQEAGSMTQEALLTLMPAIEKAVENLVTAENIFVSKWEQGALQVAVAIAQQAIGRELPQMIDVPLKLLKEALELAIGSVRLKIRMSPQDIDSLGQEIDTLVRLITPLAETEIVADIRIMPGGCYLETSQGTIDQRIESRLDRIVSELGE